ncbi:methyl-accepting chemotaxis protein [Orenia marismortui]|uniref:methyl-accepting chemotaxis protein n=1 Tax=Orenia marismortui TaxID=46469 RepID=UPI000367CBD6|nr:methyl-accepting chemotaxis protein [Orenia marismortui]
MKSKKKLIFVIICEVIFIFFYPFIVSDIFNEKVSISEFYKPFFDKVGLILIITIGIIIWMYIKLEKQGEDNFYFDYKSGFIYFIFALIFTFVTFVPNYLIYEGRFPPYFIKLFISGGFLFLLIYASNPKSPKELLREVTFPALINSIAVFSLDWNGVLLFVWANLYIIFIVIPAVFKGKNIRKDKEEKESDLLGKLNNDLKRKVSKLAEKKKVSPEELIKHCIIKEEEQIYHFKDNCLKEIGKLIELKNDFDYIIKKVKSTNNPEFQNDNLLTNRKRLFIEDMQNEEHMQQLKLNIEEISKNADKLAKHISNFKDYSDKINDMIRSISNIAKDNKLLALNASIEAAKSSIAGEGFSIIASEIKDLSEKTFEKNNQINGLVEKINFEYNESIEIFKEFQKTIKEEKQVIEKIDSISSK